MLYSYIAYWGDSVLCAKLEYWLNSLACLQLLRFSKQISHVTSWFCINFAHAVYNSVNWWNVCSSETVKLLSLPYTELCNNLSTVTQFGCWSSDAGSLGKTVSDTGRCITRDGTRMNDPLWELKKSRSVNFFTNIESTDYRLKRCCAQRRKMHQNRRTFNVIRIKCRMQRSVET